MFKKGDDVKLSDNKSTLLSTQLFTYWCNYDIYDEKLKNLDVARLLLGHKSIPSHKVQYRHHTSRCRHFKNRPLRHFQHNKVQWRCFFNINISILFKALLDLPLSAVGAVFHWKWQEYPTDVSTFFMPAHLKAQLTGSMNRHKAVT